MGAHRALQMTFLLGSGLFAAAVLLNRDDAGTAAQPDRSEVRAPHPGTMVAVMSDTDSQRILQSAADDDRSPVACPGEGDTEALQHPAALCELRHPAVHALAAYHGMTPEEVVDELRTVWPDLLTMEVMPLEDWTTVQPRVVDRVRAQLVGGTPKAAQAMFERTVLGKSLDKRIAAVIDEDAEPTTASDLRWACREVLDRARYDYDVYTDALVTAFASKIAHEEFDRSPYVMLGTRKKTDLAGKDKMLSFGAAFGDSRWSVAIDVYEGEFPALELAQAQWEDARAVAKEDIERILPNERRLAGHR